jgi:hypothetical protein
MHHLLIDGGNVRARSADGERAETRREFLQLAEDSFTTKFMLERYVANVPKQLLVDAAQCFRERLDEVLLCACILREAAQHFFDVF